MSIAELINLLPFIVIGALGFGFLVGFHELGHFLFCKLFGVRTPSFSIGFGPRIIEKKIGDTVFTLSAIPGGGYVEIAGADEPGQGEQKDRASKARDSFAVKPYYQKMLIIAGGILFNLIFAYAAVILAFAIGAPKTLLLSPHNMSATIEKVTKNSSAAAAGLQENDTITSLTADNVTLNQENSEFITKLLEYIQKNPDRQITLTVKRADQTIGVSATIGNDAGNGALGIAFSLNEVKSATFVDACKDGIKQVHYWIFATFDALAKLFKEKSTKKIGGPVMVITQMIKGAQKGFVVFLLFLAFISVNLAVMNLIPLPVFDGGQALFYTIEAIIGRPLNETIRNGIAYATWLFLIALIFWITIQDILVLVKPYLGL